MRWMKLPAVCALLAGLACGAAQASAQEQGYWRATSSMATTITGDVTIGSSKLTIDYMTFPLASIRRLKPTEVSAVFDADVNAGISGMLYRLRIPAAQHFNKKNTLCGDEDTQWMATYVTGKTLQVAFFSGDDQPSFTFESMQGTSTKCGVFGFSR